MELWATGFNAWGNLDFSSAPRDWLDLPSFTPVLKDDKIEVRALFRSATLDISSGLKFAGNPVEFKELFAALGGEKDMFWPIAVAGNEQVAALTSGYIKHFDSLKDDGTGDSVLEDDSLEPVAERECQVFDDFDDLVTEVVANITSFTALTASGTVYTWGDERIVERLGREISTECPADIPCVVEDLHSLVDKVTRISSGGTLSAALTSGHDIYIWGTDIITGPLNRLWSPTPYPLDLHGQEFLDVAVGNHHVIVLTTEHKIFVIGANGSGQLGLNDRRDHSEWTEITLPLKEQQHVTRVYAGHNNSLLLVEEIKEAGDYTEG